MPSAAVLQNCLGERKEELNAELKAKWAKKNRASGFPHLSGWVPGDSDGMAAGDTLSPVNILAAVLCFKQNLSSV